MTNKELDVAIATKVLKIDPPLETSYSTNIADAFRLLQHLHSSGWFWRLDSVHDGVICTIQNIKRKTFSVRSTTAEQAISECALRTVENNGPKEENA